MQLGQVIDSLPLPSGESPVGAIEIDPPPFAFKQPAKFSVRDIKGRVIIQGGEGFEEDGDTVIVHNGSGAAEPGLLTNRVVPRFTRTGTDAVTGQPIFEPELDEHGNPISDRFLSLEGLGLNIPLEGFTGPDTVKTFGVLIKDVENIDLRLADEQPPLTTGANRDDTVYVALAEQRGSTLRGAPDLPGSPLPFGTTLEPLRLTIVGGAGNDRVFLRQITGETTVLGGAGADTLTVSDGQLLDRLIGARGGRIIFDGDAHIDERTHQVQNLTELGFPEDLALPSVFANTGVPATAHSFTDAQGNQVFYWDADLQPIIFPGAGGLYLRAVALRDDGDIITDLVREEGVQEQGVQERGEQKLNGRGEALYLNTALAEVTLADLTDVPLNLRIPVIVPVGDARGDNTIRAVYLDADSNRTFNAFGTSAAGAQVANRKSIVTSFTDPARAPVYLDGGGQKTFVALDPDGFPNKKSFVTDFETGVPLFTDSRGLRGDIDPAVLVIDTAGPDITVYQRPEGAANFGSIVVEVSKTGAAASWIATSLTTTTRVPGDAARCGRLLPRWPDAMTRCRPLRRCSTASRFSATIEPRFRAARGWPACRSRSSVGCRRRRDT